MRPRFVSLRFAGPIVGVISLVLFTNVFTGIPSGASNPSCNDLPSHAYDNQEGLGIAYGNQALISVGSPAVPPAGGTTVEHLFIKKSPGLEVGWLIGEELGPGGDDVGFTTSPIVYGTNNTSGSGYIEDNGPAITNGSDHWYTTWFSGTTGYFRIDTGVNGSVIYNAGFLNDGGGTGELLDGGEFSDDEGHSGGSNSFTRLTFLNSSGGWEEYQGFGAACNDPNLTISYSTANLSISDSGSVS
jgi:hypothetical protein